MKKMACIAAALVGTVLPLSVLAQWTPKSTIRIVVPFAAGGPTDITARHLSRKLNDILGQPVIVDNRGGANGMIGAELVVKSRPDGYTLLMPTSSTIAINPAVYRKMPFDPVAACNVIHDARTFTGNIVLQLPGRSYARPLIGLRTSTLAQGSARVT